MGKEESFFFRVWPLVGCLYISGWPHSHAHAGPLIGRSGLKTNQPTTNKKKSKIKQQQNDLKLGGGCVGASSETSGGRMDIPRMHNIHL